MGYLTYSLPYAVGSSPTLHIRGMIASCAIKKGAIIEKCPVILIPKEELSSLFNTKLNNYYFDWTKDTRAIVLGYGSIINHSYTPNAAYRWDYKQKFMVYYAVRDIEVGDEVMINYNGVPSDTTPLPQGWVSSKSY